MEDNLYNPYLDDNDIKKNNNKKKGFLPGLFTGIIITSLLAVIIAGVFTVFEKKGTEGILDKKDRSKLSIINSILDNYYYKDIPDEDKKEAIYKGLMESANDPYTVYYTKEEYDDFKIGTTGNYAGIGAALMQDKSTMKVTISRVYEDSPAKKAGLLSGDEIISADGTLASSMDLDHFVLLIRGEEGTDVLIKYSRDGVEKEVSVKREEITLSSVSYEMLDNNIGYVAINEFMAGTKDEYDKAMEDLFSQGMEGVIFDLRANGGGLVDSVTDILDEILPEGTVVYMEDKDKKRTTYSSDEEHKIDIPITVLVSENTASAAEIFTGAIMDYEYGTVIGTKTFGKGIVQTTVPLTDGSALKITTETYYTPKGRAIHGVGLTPDIVLPLEIPDSEEYSIYNDNQVNKAKEILLKEIGKNI